MNWYIVQAYSGFEKKVVESIKDELKKHKLSEKLEEILVPTHQVTEVKKGKRTKKEKKFFPGYVLIKIELTKEIVFVCLLNQPISLISAYVDNIVHLGFAGWIWFLLTIFILFLSLFYFIKFKTQRLFIICSVCMAHFCNIILVSVLEPVIWRYSFYTELPLTVMIITLLIFSFLHNFKKNL